MLDAMEKAVAQIEGSEPPTASTPQPAGIVATTGPWSGSDIAPLARAADFGTPAPTGQAVASDALRYLGVPYQWGGTNPTSGFDCSGLVQHVYADLGITLPRTSQEQSTLGESIPSLAAARPGDLVFFEPGPGGPGHVGIYLGANQMIVAPHTGTAVHVQTITSPPVSIRRIIAPTSSGWTGTLTFGTGPVSTPLGGMGSGSRGPLDVPTNLASLFLGAAAKYGLSPQLLAAVAKVESGFDPAAKSSAGALGLMQIMPATAQGLGINPYDPAQAIDGAAQILSGNLDRFGSLPLALAAYNAGSGAVEQYGGIPPFPETQTYVTKIMGLIGSAA